MPMEGPVRNSYVISIPLAAGAAASIPLSGDPILATCGATITALITYIAILHKNHMPITKTQNNLCLDIVAYCSSPKTWDDIRMHFKNHEAAYVQQRLDEMIETQRISRRNTFVSIGETESNRITLYQAYSQAFIHPVIPFEKPNQDDNRKHG